MRVLSKHLFFICTAYFFFGVFFSLVGSHERTSQRVVVRDAAFASQDKVVEVMMGRDFFVHQLVHNRKLARKRSHFSVNIN